MCFLQLALASIVVATVAARPDGPHPAHAPAYGAPPPAYHPAPVEYDEPPKYAFTYAVKVMEIWLFIAANGHREWKS